MVYGAGIWRRVEVKAVCKAHHSACPQCHMYSSAEVECVATCLDVTVLSLFPLVKGMTFSL